MNIPVGPAVVFVLLFASFSETCGQSSLWNDRLYGVLQAMDGIVNEVTGSQDNDVKSLIDVLESLLSGIEDFKILKKSVKREISKRMTQKATQTKSTVDGHLGSSVDLKAHYSLGSMLTNLQRSNDLDRMCSGVQKISYSFTTKAICANVRACKCLDACTKDKMCDVGKAVPKMVAVLWYKVAAFLTNSLCHDSKVAEDFKSVKDMVHIIGAYASSTIDWNATFEGIARRGQVFWKENINYAMQEFEPYAKVAKFAWKACEELKSDKMCPVGSINVENSVLKVLKRNRQKPSQIYNLKKQARVNHVQMLVVIREALRQFRLSANIQDLTAKIEQNSGKMSKYLQTLATYDQDIADQDRIFIEGKLEEFEKRSKYLIKKVRKDFNAVKALAIAAKIAELTEHFITNGLNALTVLRHLPEIAVNTASIVGLEIHSRKLYEDTKTLQEAFKDNAKQITGMQEIVDDINNGHIGNIDPEAVDFIQAYGDYTPKVDEHMLAKNDALWSAYKDKACELLSEAEGLLATGVQLADVKMACEYLEGTLAEFSALRENIFEFQFDLVDSLAQIIRGAVGKGLAKKIDVTSLATVGMYSRIMSSFFRTESRLQSEASSYCQELQYLNRGEKVYVCSNKDFFTETNIDDLIAYEPDTHYDIEERFVYIPTKHQFPGDEGYINLATLAEKRKVSFRLPANKTWLNDFNWLATEEKVAPFVESFKVYLPRKNYDVITDRTKHSKTRIEIKAKGGSLVNFMTDQVKYRIPDENSQYVTVYEEGYDPAKCPRGKEILNPYSLCDNLPFMCDTTSRVPMSSVMPTILSRWELSFSVESGAEDLVWDAPQPATDFLIIAKVKLRFPAGIRKRSRITRRDESAFGCCKQAGEYRPNWRDNTCTSCPTGTASKMGGYYCE